MISFNDDEGYSEPAPPPPQPPASFAVRAAEVSGVAAAAVSSVAASPWWTLLQQQPFLPTPIHPPAASMPDQQLLALSDIQRGEYALQVLRSVSPAVLASVIMRLMPLTKRDFIAHLPTELALKVLSWCPPPTLEVCMRVSRAWCTIAKDGTVWRAQFAAHFPQSLPIVSRNLKKIARAAATTAFGESPRDKKPNPNESAHIDSTADWRYLFYNRRTLEHNWNRGIYTRRELIPHDEAVYCLQFDNDKIISGSRDHTIRVFDMQTFVHRQTFSGHSGSVLCLQYDDSFIISGSSDSTIMQWTLATGGLHRVLRGHSDSVLNLRFDSSIIVSCSKDKSVKVWQTNDGALLHTLLGHKAAVNAVQFSGNLIVSASGDKTVRVWDLSLAQNTAAGRQSLPANSLDDPSSNNPMCVRILTGHTRGIACVHFDGTICLSGSSDGVIKVWNVHTGQLLRSLFGHTNLVRTLQFDRRHIISASYDRAIKIWNFETGELLMDLAGHSHRVLKLQFDECKVVSCSQDQRIFVWDFGKDVDARYFT
ncbi:hypothetical protein HDU82_006958 [Entophlyctis luteolus]|nr:hypothetical protein HDU82_006958 [Entophlyctis luteolus]